MYNFKSLKILFDKKNKFFLKLDIFLKKIDLKC